MLCYECPCAFFTFLCNGLSCALWMPILPTCCPCLGVECSAQTDWLLGSSMLGKKTALTYAQTRQKTLPKVGSNGKISNASFKISTNTLRTGSAQKVSSVLTDHGTIMEAQNSPTFESKPEKMDVTKQHIFFPSNLNAFLFILKGFSVRF